MIFTDEEIQQVLRSDNWSVTKDLQQIAKDYNYPIELITPDMGQTFGVYDVIEAMKRVLSTQNSYPNMIYMHPKDFSKQVVGIKKYFRTRRNLNRKSKSHFRK